MYHGYIGDWLFRGVCPSCGHCPHCGHRAAPVPYYGQPYVGTPYPLTVGGGTVPVTTGAGTINVGDSYGGTT